MGANDKQVGGTHYKKGGEEHWDRMWRLYGRGYFVGCITKYVERYHEKNGIQDLEKALHFTEKLIELESPKPFPDIGMLVSDPRQVNPTGWRDFVFEGIGADGQLMTCRVCGSKILIDPYANPHHEHECGADPSPRYVNQE